MVFLKIFTWLAKISFWVTAALLAIGIYMTRSPWWLTGFGLLLLVSFRAVALCRIPTAAVIPLFLCDGYLLVAFGKIISDQNSSAWWLIVALILEFVIVGNAQNQVDEDEKKSKIARETEKRLAEEKINTQNAKDDEAGEKESEASKLEVHEEKENDSTTSETRAENSSEISTVDKKDDDFWKQKIEKHIRQLKSDEDVINRKIGDILENIYSDESPVEDVWEQKNFLGFCSKLEDCFGESIFKLAQEENISVKSNKLAGLYAYTIFMVAFQRSICNRFMIKKFSVSLYIGTEQAKKLMKALSEKYNEIPAEELEKLEQEELKNKNKFPFIWFYSNVKKYASDFKGIGGVWALLHPDQLFAWCSDWEDECLSDYISRNLKDHSQQPSTKNEDSDTAMMNNFTSSCPGSNLDDEQDVGITSEQCTTRMPQENLTTSVEETPDAFTETIRAVENGEWKKVGKIVGKGILNSLKENAENTRRYRSEFEHLSPYELASICKNTWKSSTERAAAFHVLKMKVPNEAERRRLLR